MHLLDYFQLNNCFYKYLPEPLTCCFAIERLYWDFTSMYTNGTYYKHEVSRLKKSQVTKIAITVSLDGKCVIRKDSLLQNLYMSFGVENQYLFVKAGCEATEVRDMSCVK